MSNLVYVEVPRDSVNDDTVRLVSFEIEHGKHVLSGQIVAIIETSKTIIEIAAPIDGYFFAVSKIEDMLPTGSIIGVISSDSSFDINSIVNKNNILSESNNNQIITRPARELIELHNLSLEIFSSFSIVRKEDVLAVLRKSNELDLVKRYNNAVKSLCTIKSSVMPNNILIIGAGGHGAVILDILRKYDNFNIVGFVELESSKLDTKVIDGVSVVALQDDNFVVKYPPNSVSLCIALGDNAIRLRVGEKFAALGYNFVTAIHPSATIATEVTLGVGVVIMPQAVVGVRSVIGDFAIINTCASVDHDNIIGRGTHVAPGSHLGGTVTVGDLTLIGIGVSVNRCIAIGNRCTISSGFTVFGNVSDNEVLSPKIGNIWR